MITKETRKQVYSKFGGKCAYCGEWITLKEMQVDHIIPKRNFKRFVFNKYKIPSFLSHLTKDDMDHIDNLFPACRVCNNWKSSFSLSTFRSEIEAQLKRLRKSSSNYRFALKYNLIQETPKKVVFYFETIFYLKTKHK